MLELALLIKGFKKALFRKLPHERFARWDAEAPSLSVSGRCWEHRKVRRR